MKRIKLNAHPEEARSYERLKEDLCSKFPEDRDSYADGKKKLVTELLSRAKRWREEQRNIETEMI